MDFKAKLKTGAVVFKRDNWEARRYISCEMKPFKIVVEHHSDGFVAYPLGLKGVVVGQGDTDREAVADCQSAIRFHIETFGEEAFEDDSPVLEAFITEANA